MARLIKRYESRKLYDTEESRYASLEEIADWVRRGQEVEVIDNATAEDVTAQTLSQIILEEGRSGRSRLPSELLHQLIRRGGDVLVTGVQQMQQGVDRLVQVSFDRLSPVRQAREEMTRLRDRLEELESSLVRLERDRSDRIPRGREESGRKAGVDAAPEKTGTATQKPARKPTTKKLAKKRTTRKTAATGRASKAKPPRG